MRWNSRLAVSLGAMALVAGCSSSDSSEPEGDAAGSTAGATEGSGKEPQEQQESQEPAAQTGFDECGLFEPDELAGIFGVPALHITERSINPQAEGGRLAACGYYSQDLPGISGVWINTVAGTDEEGLFAAFEGRDTGSLDNLGDRAEVVATTAPGGAIRSRQLRVIDGDVGLIISYTYEEAPGGLPAIPDAELGEAVATVAVLALERVPQELTIPDGEPEGPCAEVDLAHAAEVLGEELVAARTVLSDTGGVSCVFTGNGAALDAVVYTDPEIVENWRPPADEINAPDIADGARFDTEQGYLDARVISGDHVLAISAYYTQAVGAPATPGPQETELLRTVTEAIDS
jgi:uncharacterized protein DUF3558